MTTYEQAQANVVPADDEWFDLEVDDGIEPMEVVTSAGYNARGWEYLGPTFTGKETYQVKLVRLGYVRNLAEARKRAGEMGYRLVEGQARESFKARFPKPDGKGPIVFGGSEWRHPRGSPRVACLDALRDKWYSDFDWSGDGFFDRWRWLVGGQ